MRLWSWRFSADLRFASPAGLYGAAVLGGPILGALHSRNRAKSQRRTR